MIFEVYACFIDKFGDKDIDSWTFNNEREAQDWLAKVKEKREPQNEYQKKMGFEGTKTYYYAGIDRIGTNC